MAQTYPGKMFQNKLVRSSRAARQGDPSFLEGEDQLVVLLEDGTEHTVRPVDLKDET